MQDPKYAINPNRAIQVVGPIDGHLAKVIGEKVDQYYAASDDPITVFINSCGGDSGAEKSIRFKLKGRRSSAGSIYREYVAVVTGYAGSAAADLLICADYAIAYPNANIHCHGGHVFSSIPITLRMAEEVRGRLAKANNESTIAITRDFLKRFIFRYITFRGEAIPIRAELINSGIPAPSDLECFIELLQRRALALTNESSLPSILCAANTLHRIYTQLNEHINSVLLAEPPDGQKEFDPTEQEVLKCILDFKPETAPGTEKLIKDQLRWPPDAGEFSDFAGDMLSAYLLRYKYRDQPDSVEWLFGQFFAWMEFFLQEDDLQRWAELDEMGAEGEDEKAQMLWKLLQSTVAPLFFFAVSVAQLLHSGEYLFSAEEAYWLGLIDEVRGRDDDLPSRRLLMESMDR